MFLAQSFTAHDCWCSRVVAKKFTTFELAGGRSRGCLSCSCGRPRGKISLCWWSIHREGRIPVTVLTDSEQMLGLGDLVVPRAPWCKGNLGSSQPDGPIPEFPCWYIKSGTKAEVKRRFFYEWHILCLIHRAIWTLEIRRRSKTSLAAEICNGAKQFSYDKNRSDWSCFLVV
ncbi:unnamed protein product [Urochloa humidicola]